MFIAEICIQIAGFDAREFGEIIDHLFLRRNVVIDEWYAFVGSIPVNWGMKMRGELM